MLAAIAQSSPDGVLVVAPGGEVLFMNERFPELWQFPASIVVSRSDQRALVAAMDRVAEPEAFLARVEEIYRTRVPSHDELVLRDGRVLDRYGSPLHGAGGEYLGWAWYFRDVSALKQAEQAQRLLAETLQANLLPPSRPSIPGMEVATRYRPADSALLVGGDFYDVFRLGPNDWGLVIGDVCGKGARAAALTARTRYTIRAAAVHHFLPSAVLAELNADLFADAEEHPWPEADDRFASVVFARLELDRCGAWVTLASAGHPRPTVVRRAGWIDVRGHVGTPVGLFEEAVVADDRVGLGPGDALVFCTDGITEARSPDGAMFGDEALARTLLGCSDAAAESIAERLVGAALAFGGGRSHDDVAVLVLQVPADAATDPDARLAAVAAPDGTLPLPGYPVGEGNPAAWAQRPLPPRHAEIRLPPEPASAAHARRFLAGVLHSWRMPELATDDASLLATELATNAIQHAQTTFTMRVSYDGAHVRVEVHDGSAILPRPRVPAAEDLGGRGLLLVERLAARWGREHTPEGKRVWFEVPAPIPEP